MTTPPRPVVAIFRPPGDRADRATETLESLGAEVVHDPLIRPRPTGALPRTDADVTVFTSSTAGDLLDGSGWSADGTSVAAIGPRTADALREVGISVDVVPDRFDSSGLVEALADRVAGRRVEVARSDHGTETLPAGLEAAGAYVHETVLYRLERPEGAGAAVDAVRAGTVDALAFTSSLTVEHFVDLAEGADPERLLEGVLVGAIGEPTARTAEHLGLEVDVIAPEATFESLARALMAALQPEGSRHP